jgi:hypothetical protein
MYIFIGKIDYVKDIIKTFIIKDYPFKMNSNDLQRLTNISFHDAATMISFLSTRNNTTMYV